MRITVVGLPCSSITPLGCLPLLLRAIQSTGRYVNESVPVNPTFGRYVKLPIGLKVSFPKAGLTEQHGKGRPAWRGHRVQIVAEARRRRIHDNRPRLPMLRGKHTYR